MQITPNDPGADSVEETSTTNALPEGQEQVVLVLDLRRALPESGENNSIPDLGLFLADYEPEQAQALSYLLDSVVEVLGFDPTLSQVSLSDDGNAITLSDLESVVAGLSPSSEPVEIQTEQSIDTGVTVAVDSEGVAVVLESTDPTPEEGDSEPIPEAIEDVPHDQEPEDADPGPVDPPTEG